MRSSTRRLVRFFALRALPLLLAAAACSKGPVAPRSYLPLECGQGNGQSAAAAIGEAGGAVAVRGHSLTVPAQAVSARTSFTITERQAGYIGVEVEPHGTQFARNATLTLSFARCGGVPAGFEDLRVVEVRRGSTEVIRVLPSEVDARAQTVTTTSLQHLSGYLIGGNRAEQ